MELREEKEVLELEVGNRFLTDDDEDIGDKEQSTSLFGALYF